VQVKVGSNKSQFKILTGEEIKILKEKVTHLSMIFWMASFSCFVVWFFLLA
jgi:hypothetical protein